jgi:xanthine dehydrogenase YagR molybdenum-binding subunit
MTKRVNLKVGLPDNLEEINIDIPENEPKPWDGTSQFNIIGKRIPRIDGKYKTTGRAKYTFDIQLPGMLHARILRSPYPAAIVKKINTKKAETYPGVKAIVMVQDELPLTLRFAGQEICAVAAENAYAAEEALKRISVEYETKPFVVDVDKARQGGAPLVFDPKKDGPKSNVEGPSIFPEDATADDIDAVLKNSEVTAFGTYRTQVQTHSPMETHGLVAQWGEGDQITVWASTQATFSYRDQLADYFKVPKSNVRVITEYMGGGFGSKLRTRPHSILALKLSKATGKPVRLMLERWEDQLCTGNRPNSVQTVSIGAQANGKITGVKLVSYGTAGVGGGAGTSGPAKWIYDQEKTYTEEYDVFTNAGPGAPFRAPGHPQGAFALEQTIDDVAFKLKMDPLEFRRLNTQSDAVRLEEYKVGSEKFGWSKRNPQAAADSGLIKRGMGMANSLWYYITGRGYDLALRVNDDGSLRVMNGVQDIGGGITTVLAAVVAEELGLQPENISVTIGDTNFGLGPSSGGSQTTAGITPAARNAAYAAKQKMIDIGAGLLEVKPEALTCEGGKIFVKTDPQKSLSWKEVAKKIRGGQFTVIGERTKDYFEVKRWKLAGVQFAEVEVDTETGVIRVKRMVAAQDCGQAMDRLTTENQINGGIIQGISYALFENRILDRNTGTMVNANLESYKIAGSMDIPEIESVILDYTQGQSSTGAAGIGEPATIPTAAAIANAVYHAIGVRIRQIPMTPAVVLAALNSVKGGA